MSWTKIWNEGGSVLDRATRSQDLAAVTFLLEAKPTAQRELWRSGDGQAGLALATTDDGAVELRHRDRHLRTAPGIVQPGESFRLLYRAAEGQTLLELRSLERPGVACVTQSFARTPCLATDFIPQTPVIESFGGLAALANHNAPQADRSGLQVGTPVATPAGARAVDTLRPGDVVMTDHGQQAIVQRTERGEMVSLGSMNAVRLRAPHFGLPQDTYVSRRTQIMLSGPDVDYVFGTDRVAATAGDLVNHVSVLRDLTEPVRDLVTVELDRPGCLVVGEVPIAGADGAVDCPVIDRIAAQSLLDSAGDLRALIA